MNEYLELNISNEKLGEIVRNHILEKKPLSFTRIGDGEIRLITNKITPAVKKKIMISGVYKNFEEAHQEANKIIHRCLVESDIIGIMDKNNPVASKIDWNPQVWSISKNYLEKIGRKKDLLVGDHMASRSRFFGDPKEFKKLINGNPICIISPRISELKENRLEDILGCSITYLKTPLIINMKDRDSLFLGLDKIKEDIVIFGCSIRGKDFGIYLRDRGKIALDFGATLDAWAGIESRNWFKKGGIQEYCMIKRSDK